MSFNCTIIGLRNYNEYSDTFSNSSEVGVILANSNNQLLMQTYLLFNLQGILIYESLYVYKY